MRRIRAPSAVVLIGISAACHGRPSRDVGVLVRDSAGVEIVVNQAPVWTAGLGWKLSSEPVLRIDREDDERYEFNMIHDATRLDDGIAVAAGGAREVRFYDRQGTFLSRLGRRGKGPGEFVSLSHLWRLPGDSVMVFDGGLHRISVFAPGGEFARSFAPSWPGGRGAMLRLVGPMDGGRLLALQRVFGLQPETTGIEADSTYVLSLNMEGHLVDTLGFVPEHEIYVNNAHGRLWTSPAPFAPTSYWAVTADGYVFGSGRSFEIGVYRADGSLRRLIRWARDHRRVTSQAIEVYKEELTGNTTSPEIVNWARHVAEDMEFPATMPAHGSIEVDPDGDLWVSEFPRPGRDVQTWHVFDSSGRLLGAVVMPLRLRVYEIGSDYVLGQWQDDLNVQSVRMYQVIKTG